MTSSTVDHKDISAGHLVDTLFGVQEEPDRTTRHRAAAEEELPHYLFDGYDNERQSALPLINVAHYRPKIVSQKNIVDLIPYADELALFERRWGFVKKPEENRESWCLRVEKEAVPVLEKLVALSQEHQLLQPRALYAYFFCAAQEDTLYLYKDNKKEVFLTIDLPRLKNGVCMADKIARKDSGAFDTIAAVGVNMGRNATEMAKRWLSAGKEVDYRYLHGFALEMLNAMTLYTAGIIAAEECCMGDVYGLGSAKQGAAKVQSALIKMLDASLIDIAFSRNYLMMPEYSSLALVFPR